MKTALATCNISTHWSTWGTRHGERTMGIFTALSSKKHKMNSIKCVLTFFSRYFKQEQSTSLRCKILWAASWQNQQNSMCSQRRLKSSLGIHPVWPESSLSTRWVAKEPSFLHADSEDLIRLGRCPGWSVFTGCTVILLVLSWGSSYYLIERIISVNLYLRILVCLSFFWSSSWKTYCKILKTSSVIILNFEQLVLTYSTVRSRLNGKQCLIKTDTVSL